MSVAQVILTLRKSELTCNNERDAPANPDEVLPVGDPRRGPHHRPEAAGRRADQFDRIAVRHPRIAGEPRRRACWSGDAASGSAPARRGTHVTKAKYFTSVFEGGLITLAALDIDITAVDRLFNHRLIAQPVAGLLATLAATAVNLGFGLSRRAAAWLHCPRSKRKALVYRRVDVDDGVDRRRSGDAHWLALTRSAGRFAGRP